MEDSLLYNKNIEESIDLFNDNIKYKNFDKLPEFLEYYGTLLKKGKQGLVGYLINKNTKYVYKISQYLDFVIDQEYNVMRDLNTIRDYCPHFVKTFAKFRLPITSNYKKALNPFCENKEYKNIISDILVMENIEESKKFFKYIKKGLPTTVLLSIVKQTLLASLIAYNKVNFTHYDLHSDNIMIKKCNENSVFIYIIDNEYFIVPTYGFYPVIIDFGFSYSKSSDNTQMNCSLAHTKYGFIQCESDKYNDTKLFLCSISKEINKYKNNSNSKKFRNFVKNNYKRCNLDLDSGWNDEIETNINDIFIENFKKTFNKSPFFKNQAEYILDLLQTLIILPLKNKKTNEKTKDLLSLVINEFSKIENFISDDFFNLFIFKEMIISVNKNRELYTISDTRTEAVTNFKYDILRAIDSVAKFCNPKVNWEKLLCSLLCLSKNLENFCFNEMKNVRYINNRNYSNMQINKTTEIIEAIEYIIPSHFDFDENTIIYEWNSDTENSKKKTIDKSLIEILNKTHPFERGQIYKEYENL